MSTQQFYPEEFDQWADGYDEQVRSDSGFPFDGYSRVLNTVVRLAQARPGDSVLDLGTGTGNLAVLLARAGGQVWGLDFSEPMLEKARVKLPAARFARADVREDLPPDFSRRYQVIVSGYTFHHFPLDEKVTLLRSLSAERLLPGGRLVIGDLSFPDAAAHDELARQFGPEWEEEYYWLADESLAALRAAGMDVQYTQVSSCAGVYLIQG